MNHAILVHSTLAFFKKLTNINIVMKFIILITNVTRIEIFNFSESKTYQFPLKASSSFGNAYYSTGEGVKPKLNV